MEKQLECHWESQLRLKNVLGNEDVQKAIATARQYEKDFFGDDLICEEEVGDESRSDDDEWGVEVRLIKTHGLICIHFNAMKRRI